MQLPKIIAHRGASGYAPENTLAAFQEAKRLGVDWVEFDVQLSKDGHLVVIHDETVNRTTDGEGVVREKKLAEIKKLDAGTWFSTEYLEEKVPTLNDVLTCAEQLSLAMNIELKPNSGDEEATVLKVLDMLNKHWPKSSPKPLLSSFNPICMKLLNSTNLASAYPLGYLINEWDDDWLKKAKDLNPVSVHLNNEIVTSQRIDEIKAAGFVVLVYTVNIKERAEELYDMGVDGVFTDFVDLMDVR